MMQPRSKVYFAQQERVEEYRDGLSAISKPCSHSQHHRQMRDRKLRDEKFANLKWKRNSLLARALQETI